MMTGQDPLQWMAEDIRRTATRGFIKTEVRLDPLLATPLLEPDGVVWQITTLEA